LASGRSADVFALDEHRVLRRYRAPVDVAAEAAVMTYVAGHGFPVPRVHRAAGRDLVMERLHGPTMLQAAVRGALGPVAAARLLADLHHRLHELPPLLGADPAARILHLDLHPDNVVLTPDGPVVIDWCNADEGPPDLDVAVTAVIIAEVAVGTAGALAPMAEELLAAFLRCAPGEPLRELERAVQRRRGDAGLGQAEKARLPAAEALIRARQQDDP
jgi:aminoglycoside phosphotransferase (APT) family kinase protein